MQAQPLALWLALIARTTDHVTEWLLCAGCGTTSRRHATSCRRMTLSFKYPGATPTQQRGSMSRDTGKPYAAQTRPLIDPVTPCITQLTVRSAFVLSVSADHDSRPDASSRPASLRPGEWLWSGGRLGAQEPLGFDVPAHGKACPRGHRRRRRLFGGSEASGYSMAGRRAVSMCV